MTASDVARILLCEDSRSYALALRRFLEHDPDLEVVGTCGTAKGVVPAVRRLQPDLLILDLDLPDGNGIDAIPKILAAAPLPILVLSDQAPRGSRTAAAALAAGALDAQPKQGLDIRSLTDARSVMFRRYVKRLSRARVGESRVRRARPARKATLARRRIAAIGICASTGGPAALRTTLAALPAGFPIPLLVVQHITPGFLTELVRWLDRESRVPVAVAPDDAPLEPGVWFAPESAHLTVDPSLRLRHDHGTVAGYHRPAGDVLFASLATTLGDRAASVVLTGMGSDGSEGLGTVGSAGGLTIAQDEATSAIYGMPRAAAERGAELVLPLAEIGPQLASLTPAPRGGPFTADQVSK